MPFPHVSSVSTRMFDYFGDEAIGWAVLAGMVVIIIVVVVGIIMAVIRRHRIKAWWQRRRQRLQDGAAAGRSGGSGADFAMAVLGANDDAYAAQGLAGAVGVNDPIYSAVPDKAESSEAVAKAVEGDERAAVTAGVEDWRGVVAVVAGGAFEVLAGGLGAGLDAVAAVVEGAEDAAAVVKDTAV